MDQPTPTASAANEPLQKIDVRPLLAAGHEPRGTILDAVAKLPSDGALIVIAPFFPRPLIALLTQRGQRVRDEESAPGVWRVCVQPASAPEILDVRDLPAPEPMEKILQACATLAPGAACIARTPRYPHALGPLLEQRNLVYKIQEELDGTALIHIRKPSA